MILPPAGKYSRPNEACYFLHEASHFSISSRRRDTHPEGTRGRRDLGSVGLSSARDLSTAVEMTDEVGAKVCLERRGVYSFPDRSPGEGCVLP